MSNLGIGVLEAHPLLPALGCPKPASLPQIQICRLSDLQQFKFSAIHAPPPTPESHSP
jgi:hypothetical protein